MTLQIAMALALLVYAAGVTLAVIVGHRLEVAIRRASRSARSGAVDHAYTVWLDAHHRCDRALRVWNSASPAARAGAYRAYLAELEREEEAARRPARLQPAAVA